MRASGRLRVLMVAYACSPVKQGEHRLGWEWARRMSRLHDVTLLTRDTHVADCLRHAGGGLEVRGVEDRSIRFLRRLGWPGTALYYWLWQNGVARAGRALLAERPFDLVHQVTFHTYRIPGRLAWAGVPPFVWGPIAGLERVPRPFLPGLGRGALREMTRAAANAIMPHLASIRRTLRRARVVLVSSLETLERLREVHDRPYEWMAANAVEDLPGAEPWDGERPLQLLALGTIVRIRAYDLVLRALAGLPRESLDRVQLTFVGDGPDRRRLERLVRALGLGARVVFTGRRPRSEALAHLARAHLLVFPALRDSGGSAVAEAMAAGVPVAALDLGGPASMLAQGGGFLVPARSPRQAEQDLCALLLRVLCRPESLRDEGARGRAAAGRLFDWEARTRRMDEIYREACGLVLPRVEAVSA